MPVTTIPLAFAPNQRGPIITSTSAPTKDARVVRGFNTIVPNNVTGSKEAFLEKIPGWAVSSTPGGSNSGTAIYQSAKFSSGLTAFGGPSSIYYGSTTLGSVDGGSGAFVSRFTEGALAQDPVALFTTTVETGWFFHLASTSGVGNTFTADTTSGNLTLTSVSDLTGLYVGQLLSGTGIAATARIATIAAPSTVTMTANATANGTGVTITREYIAKIIDSDYTGFTDRFGDIVELDGYCFQAVTGTGSPSSINPTLIAQSDLNDVTSWSSSNVLAPNITDAPRGLAIYRDMVAYFGSNSIQFFRNAGNPSGSVLSQVDELSVVGIGCYLHNGSHFASANQNVVPLCRLAGTLYWLGIVDGVISAVYRMNGFSPEPVSKPAVLRAITAVLQNSDEAPIITFDGFSMFGYNFLYIGSGDVGYLYCVENGEWYEAGFFAGGMRVSGFLGGSSTNLRGVRLTGSNGKIYVMSRDGLTHQDDSAAYTMTIQTPELVLNDGQPFSVHEVELIGDTQASGLSTLSSCDDDYTTFTVRGAFDMTRQRKVVNRCGHYKNHVAFKIEHSANTAFRAQALKIHWSPAVGRGFR